MTKKTESQEKVASLQEGINKSGLSTNAKLLLYVIDWFGKWERDVEDEVQDVNIYNFMEYTSLNERQIKEALLEASHSGFVTIEENGVFTVGLPERFELVFRK